MNILLCSWANIFEPEIIATFDELGFNIDKFTTPLIDTFSDNNYLQLLSKQLLLNKYNFVFTVNYNPIVSMTCNIHNIKYISWIADSPCIELNSFTITNSCNYIFIFDKVLYEYYHKESPLNVYYLPLGCNVTRLDNIVTNKEEYLKYSTDISFVGSLYKSRTKYSSIAIPEYWYGYFEGIIESQLCMPSYNILNDTISDEAVTIFAKAVSKDDMVFTESNKLFKLTPRSLVVDNYIGKECSYRDRIQILDRLSKNFEFGLYTNEDTNLLPYANNRGIVEPFEEVFKVYKSSKINLNITSKTVKSGLPLRMFDIMGAGGFLITNYQSEIPEFFEIGNDMVVYESIDDLISKTNYYLSHEEKRLEIAQNGYNKVKNQYQFKFKILSILEAVFHN